jgi:hypothetical protein
MAANTQPKFPATQNVSWATVAAADTSLIAPTTAGVVAFTAGANGSRIDAVKIRALGTNAATVMRFFVNDGTGTTAADFALIYEVVLAATTVSQTAITGIETLILPANYDGQGDGNLPPYLEAGQKLYISIGTLVAAGYEVSVYGGDY